jgi:long-chain fatty acid transport protein
MVARFSGEHGEPTTANPTAIYFNPAGLALEDGQRLLVDITYGINMATYERFAEALSTQPPSDLALAANTGEGTLFNTSIVPFMGVASDLGTGLPFGVGLAFYVPFGGQSVWDLVDDVSGAPGAVAGPQRWWAIEGALQTLVLSAGAAYRIEPWRLSLGASFNVLFSSIDSLQAQSADNSDDVVAAGGTLKEGRVLVQASSTDVSLGLGLLWEPVAESLWLGVSYQSRPNLGDEMAFTGTLESVLGTASPSQSQVTMRQQLPDTFRLGMRYRPAPAVELRLFGDITLWSAFDQQCFVNTDLEDDPQRACQINPNGSLVHADSLVVWNAVRRWNDTFGVRLGASWWVAPEVELMVGTGFDRNAIPDETFEPGLLDFDIITAALGARIEVIDWLALGLTATNWFALERDTRGAATFSALLPPSRQPNSAGVYNQNILTFTTVLEITLGTTSAASGD